jgi:hypothetical protein
VAKTARKKPAKWPVYFAGADRDLAPPSEAAAAMMADLMTRSPIFETPNLSMSRGFNCVAALHLRHVKPVRPWSGERADASALPSARRSSGQSWPLDQEQDDSSVVLISGERADASSRHHPAARRLNKYDILKRACRCVRARHLGGPDQSCQYGQLCFFSSRRIKLPELAT